MVYRTENAGGNGGEFFVRLLSGFTLVQNRKSQLSEYVYPQRVIGGFPLEDCLPVGRQAE